MNPLADNTYGKTRIPSVAACVAAHILIENNAHYSQAPHYEYGIDFVLYQLQLISIASTGTTVFDCDFVANTNPRIPDLGFDIGGLASGSAYPRSDVFGESYDEMCTVIGGRLNQRKIAFIDDMIRIAKENAARQNLATWWNASCFPFDFTGEGTPYRLIAEIAKGKHGEKRREALRYVKREDASWENVNRPFIPRHLLFEQVDREFAKHAKEG